MTGVQMFRVKAGLVMIAVAAAAMLALAGAPGRIAASDAAGARGAAAGVDQSAPPIGAALLADIPVVLGQGYDVMQVSVEEGYASGSLIAISAMRYPSADGKPQWVFFFNGSTYLGTDTAIPSNQLGITGGGVDGNGNSYVNVRYANYAASDPLCCPSGPPVTITYTWDGTNLTPDGTPPGH